MKKTCYIVGDTLMPIKCGEELIKRDFEIMGVITRDKRVERWATQNNIKVAHTTKSDLKSFLSSSPFDYLFGIFNTVMIKEDILKLPQKLSINYHDSLLPKYAGMNSTSWAIMEGETKYGVTWHIMEKTADQGAILVQEPISISRGDTPSSLSFKCFTAGLKSFNILISKIEDQTLTFTEQDYSLRTYYGLYKKPSGAGIISFNKNSFVIDQLVRGLTFDNNENYLCLPKIRIEDSIYAVGKIAISTEKSNSSSKIVNLNDNMISISTGNRNVEIMDVSDLTGRKITIKELINKHDLCVDYNLNFPSDDVINKIDEFYLKVGPYENYWASKIASSKFLTTKSEAISDKKAVLNSIELFNPGDVIPEAKNELLTLVLVYLAKVFNKSNYTIGYLNTDISLDDISNIFSKILPFKVNLDLQDNMEVWDLTIADEKVKIKESESFAIDLIMRYPVLLNKSDEIRSLFDIVINESDNELIQSESSKGNLITFSIIDKKRLVVSFDEKYISIDNVNELFAQWEDFVYLVKAWPTIGWEELSTKSISTQNLLMTQDQRKEYDSMKQFEDILRNYNGIKDLVLITFDDRATITACIVSDQTINESEIKSYLANNSVSIPFNFIQIDRIPLDNEQKADVSLLKKVVSNRLSVNNFTPSRNEMDDCLIKIWAEILDVPSNEISIDKNFFELGGNSLKLMLLLSKTIEQFEIQIDVTEFFNYPTIHLFSDWLSVEVDKPNVVKTNAISI